MGQDMYDEMRTLFGNEGVHKTCGTRHPVGFCPGNLQGAIQKIPRVREWRITKHRLGMTIRFWISQTLIPDPHWAKSVADQAINASVSPDSMQDFATSIMEYSDAFNSVEVCDENGDGVCIHRDWP